LIDIAESYHDLAHFYQHQKPTWEKMLHALATFSVNRAEIEKDEDAETAILRLDTIRKAASPYGMVKEIDGLIQQVKAVNDALVEKHREAALNRIDAAIRQVDAELEHSDALELAGNSALRPLQVLRQRALDEQSIGNIHLSISEVSALVDSAVDKIEKAVAAREHERQVKAARLVKETSNVPQKPSPPIAPQPKRRQVVRVSDLVTKPFLETTDDVDEFLKALEQRLKAVIAANERIRIE
jgi:hypothetical protein